MKSIRTSIRKSTVMYINESMTESVHTKQIIRIYVNKTGNNASSGTPSRNNKKAVRTSSSKPTMNFMGSINKQTIEHNNKIKPIDKHINQATHEKPMRKSIKTSIKNESGTQPAKTKVAFTMKSTRMQKGQNKNMRSAS